MSLYKPRKNGKAGRVWWCDYRDENGKRRRVSTRVRDRKAAELIEARLLLSVQDRRHGGTAADPVAARKPVEFYVELYLARRGRDVSAQHAAKAGRTLRRMAEQQQWRTPRDITPQSIERHLEWVAGGNASPHYHNNILGHARAFCDFLMRHRPPVLDHNPAAMVGPRPVPLTDCRRWLEEHEIRLLRQAPRPPYCRQSVWPLVRLFWDVAIETGLRCGENRAVRVGHLHLDVANPFVELPAANTKSGRFEAVPLSEYIVGELDRATHGLAPGVPLYQTRYNGRTIVMSTPPVSTLHRALRSVGVEPVDADGRVVDNHALRYTFAHRMIRAGLQQANVQRLMRHKDSRTTANVYARAGKLEAFEAMRQLDRYAREAAS